MLELIVGPVLITGGLALVYLAVQGVRPSLPGVLAHARPRGRTMTRDDLLIGEVLSEMLHIREEVASLQDQISTLKKRRGGASKAAV